MSMTSSATLPRALLLLGLACAPLAAPAARAGEAPPPPKEAEFVQLGDFTINVPSGGHHREYLVLTVAVETPSGAADKLRDISPRVQDAILRRLMAMSEQGALKPNQTDPMTIKDALYETIAKLRPDGVKEVLITRILYS